MVLGRQPILDIHRHVAALDGLAGDPLHASPVSPRPAPPMHQNNRWQQFLRRGTMDVEDPVGIALVIGEVTTHLHSSRARVHGMLRPYARTRSDSQYSNTEADANRDASRMNPHAAILPAS